MTDTHNGGVAEWLKAAVLKTVERKFRRFESCPLRQTKTVLEKNGFCLAVRLWKDSNAGFRPDWLRRVGERDA